MADFIPTQDAQALGFMQTFANTIAAGPAVYQLGVPDAVTLTNAVNAFASAQAIAIAKATRTEVTIGLRDQARYAAEQLVRQYAALIRPNAGISDAAKEAIGLTIPSGSREPIYAPASSPLLNILGATPGAHTLRFADSSTPTSGRKPFGAIQIQLFVAVGAAPTADESTAQFYGAFTRNPIAVGFAQAEDGQVATYFGRWASRRGDTGPWSLPVSMRIAA